MRIHSGRSKDALNWTIEHDPISFVCVDPDIGDFVYGYDPRVVRIEDRYYITWCNGYHGPTIGVAYTKDFATFYQLENAFCPLTAMGALPRKIKGNFAMPLGRATMDTLPSGTFLQ